MWAKAANAIGFQLVWICCVAGAARGAYWLGPMAAGLFAAATLSFDGKTREDATALILTLPLGIALDSAFSATGWLRYAGNSEAGLAPIWIGALWLAFAFSLNHSLGFLRERLALAALLGLLCAPLSYVAAERLGAVEFAGPRSATFVLLAASWASLLPMLLGLLRYASSTPRRNGHPA